MKHDPQYDKLAALGDWELKHDNQDIRGRQVIDENGKELGVVEDLLVDEQAERIAAVRMKDGSTCGIDRIEITDDKVLYLNAGAATSQNAGTGNEKSVPIVEEDVAIGKRVVDGGTIQVRSRTVTDQVSEDVKLRSETVDVDRVEVNREISAKDADGLFANNDRTIEVTERNEEAVVSKTARVTGEVVVSKDVAEHVEHVEETERHTEVDIDRSNAADNTQRR